MTVWGLTGGIASGKTTVANLFKQYDIPIINVDVIAHDIQKNNDVIDLILNQFGGCVFNQETHEIDRKKLGNIVFNDINQLNKLNNIMQPLIKNKIKHLLLNYDQSRLVVLDIPLLFEQHYEKLVDKIIVVYVNKKTQIERLKKRNNLELKEALQRIQIQLSLEKKKQLADYVIDNNQSIEQTKIQVIKLLRSYQNKGN
ncbi:MAG: dephospho-CoA kinase [Firmicutes bacterium]|uniref:Dephospho-CoA kinase n=1 Tax=Candidatus Gallilactobacillus intestinavium TaxID=2840838 RepID=A0A9D9E7G2_9LACO|nr:dephospho-CoA kinase [Candidatus Gallilactobacillus intestinavium]